MEIYMRGSNQQLSMKGVAKRERVVGCKRVARATVVSQGESLFFFSPVRWNNVSLELFGWNKST